MSKQPQKIHDENIEKNNIEKGYAILGEMIGIAETDSTDESVNHDEVIYELDSKPSMHMSASICGKSEK